MGTFKDYFSGHAADYRAFRPTYPPELFRFFASVAPTCELVWDCGTGNGQAAVLLGDHFARVFATDASTEQVRHAESHPNVEYAVATAEKCPLPDSSVGLVTVAQALHWFDHDRFYAEVNRVCKPGAVIAATCYHSPSVGREIDRVLHRWEDFIRPYWTPERAWVDAGYRTIPFPFQELPKPELEVVVLASLAQFLGYLGTWSATKLFMAAHCTDPLERFVAEFGSAWGAPATVRTISWTLAIRVGRI